MSDILFPDVKVKLTGKDGNVFNVIGLVSQALKKAGQANAASDFAKSAMNSESYDAVLQLCARTVRVS